MTDCTHTMPKATSYVVPALNWSKWLRAGVALLSADLVKVTDWLANRREIAKQRRELAGLSDRMLKDIGVSRVQAAEEYHKPFWQ